MKLVIDIDEKEKEDFIKRGLQKGVIATAIENGKPVKKATMEIHGEKYNIYMESANKAESEVDGIVISRNLCDSCVTKGCIFQSGIVRSHCDFYRAESEEDK